MFINVRVIPNQSNRIRAVAGAHPGLTPREIGKLVGSHPHLVELALAKGNKRRRKSVAP